MHPEPVAATPVPVTSGQLHSVSLESRPRTRARRPAELCCLGGSVAKILENRGKTVGIAWMSSRELR
jgi:hypothetical protein